MSENSNDDEFQETSSTASTRSEIKEQTFTLSQVSELFRQFNAVQQPQHISPPVAIVSAPMQIPQNEYKNTSTAQSKAMESMKFSNNSSLNRETLKAVNILLAECDLQSLVLGTRPKPTYSPENTFGYTPNSVRMVGSEIILTPKDDLFNYHHDQARLFMIMHTITAKDLLYLIPQALVDKDGVAWYKAIMDHVHGTTNTDIRKAKRSLEDLKTLSTKTIKENIATLEEAFRHVDMATMSTISPDDKLYHLHEKLGDDKRPSVLAIMAMSKSSKTLL